jgi:hypothetical protein
MLKDELIARIRTRLAGEERTRGEKAFLGFFVEYLRRLDIKRYEQGGFRTILDYLPQMVGDAFEDFRTSEAEWVLSYRIEYESATERPVPNLQQIGASELLVRSCAIVSLSFLFRDIVGEERMREQLDSYLNAESRVLQLYIDKFLRLVYRKGLFNLIKDESGGFAGKFGEVSLRCYICAGRVMFTFARSNSQGADDIQVSFLAEDGDQLAYTAGVQSVCASLSECMAMIDEVIAYWPIDKAGQARQFAQSNDVFFALPTETESVA